MANEITVTASLQCTNSNFIMPKRGAAKTINQSTPGGDIPGLVVATNAAQGVDVSTTGIASLGWAYIKNLDTVAFVQWGPKVAGTLHVAGRLKAGEEIVVRLEPGATYAVKSSIASSKVTFVVLED